MTGKFKKNILFIIIALAVIALVAGYFLWNQPHRNVKDAEAVEISAVSLYNVFINDSAKAKAGYLNKILKVSGIISSVSVNQKNQKIILLKTNEAGASVNCTMEENINNYKTGDNIVIKGICIGYIPGDADMKLPGDVFLTRCYRSL